jgi:hypothetical protein
MGYDTRILGWARSRSTRGMAKWTTLLAHMVHPRRPPPRNPNPSPFNPHRATPPTLRVSPHTHVRSDVAPTLSHLLEHPQPLGLPRPKSGAI